MEKILGITVNWLSNSRLSVSTVNTIGLLPNTQFNSPGSADSISGVYTHLTMLSGSQITAKLITEFQLNK